MEGYWYIAVSQWRKSLYKIICRQKAFRRIAKAQRYPQSARRKLPLQHGVEFRDVRFFRPPAAITKHICPYGAATRKHTHIKWRSRPLKVLKIAFQRGGIHTLRPLSQYRFKIPFQRVVVRPCRRRPHTAVSVYYGGKTLHKLGSAKAI